MSMRPFRPLDIVGTLWSAATENPPVSIGTAAAYRTLLLTIRRLVVGRTVTVRLESGTITMTVTEFDSRLDVRRLAVGALDDVRLVATDITWEASRFERAEVLLHNVRLTPSALVVAGPVEVSLDVPTSALEHLFLLATPRLAGHVGADGVARLHWARRPAMGHVEIDAELDGAALFLKGRAMAFGRRHRRWKLPGWTPAYRVDLPPLPHGLALTDVDFEPELLRVRGMVPEWRMEITRQRLEDLFDEIVGQRRR